MLKIVAKMSVKAGHIEEFKELAKDLIKKSRAEAGNVFYTLNQSVANENELAFIECWKDQAAIETHKATEHFTGTLPKLANLCENTGAIEVFNEVEF